jgi:hypothetical protein
VPCADRDPTNATISAPSTVPRTRAPRSKRNGAKSTATAAGPITSVSGIAGKPGAIVTRREGASTITDRPIGWPA